MSILADSKLYAGHALVANPKTIVLAVRAGLLNLIDPTTIVGRQGMCDAI